MMYINNNYENHILCDDWGFYIDIENLTPSYKAIPEIVTNKYNKSRIFKTNLTNLTEIDEEYEYYKKLENEYSSENELVENEKLIKHIIKNNNTYNTIFKVSSTTIITAFLTYFVFCVL